MLERELRDGSGAPRDEQSAHLIHSLHLFQQGRLGRPQELPPTKEQESAATAFGQNVGG